MRTLINRGKTSRRALNIVHLHYGLQITLNMVGAAGAVLDKKLGEEAEEGNGRALIISCDACCGYHQSRKQFSTRQIWQPAPPFLAS